VHAGRKHVNSPFHFYQPSTASQATTHYSTNHVLVLVDGDGSRREGSGGGRQGWYWRCNTASQSCATTPTPTAALATAAAAAAAAASSHRGCATRGTQLCVALWRQRELVPRAHGARHGGAGDDVAGN